MDIEKEIWATELSLRELARKELIEHRRHRDEMIDIWAARAEAQKKLDWLKSLTWSAVASCS